MEIETELKQETEIPHSSTEPTQLSMKLKSSEIDHLILQKVDEFGKVHQQIIPKHLWHKYQLDDDDNDDDDDDNTMPQQVGKVEVMEMVEDEEYWDRGNYVVENVEGSEYDLADNEQFIVEEYDDDDDEYETVYIQSEDPDSKEEEVVDDIQVEGDVEDDQPLQLIYECSLCQRTFRTPSGVTRHISLVHSKEAEDEPSSAAKTDELAFSLCPCCGEPSDSAHTSGDFSCEQCGKMFIQQNSLDRHKSIEHPQNDDKYICYECKKEFPTKQNLIDHSKVHSLKAVKCEDCGREFSRKFHLDRHIGQTGCMGTPKQVYECRVCKRSFARKDNLADHLKIHAGILTERKKQFRCGYCEKEFKGKALLQVHQRTHTGERPFGCDICEKRFPSSGALSKHRRKHTGEKPYTCQKCGARFAAKETLNRHWRTHTGDKPHKCNFCGKAFIQASQLRAHIFHHTGENAFTCPHCGRAFNRKLRLTTHIKFVHDGAVPLSCPREGCTKTFFRKEDIHRHLMIHSGEKPFDCAACGKSFAAKSSLRVHQNIHKIEQPVACEVCNRAFIRKDCLMRHMRARHREVLEDIMASAEKKRLQTQLFQAVGDAAKQESLKESIVWNEMTLTESIRELLSLLVDEECLTEFGYPDAPVDKVLESVIRRCGHTPASGMDYDYITKMRENAKLLFTVVIDDKTVRDLLNNQTVDEVIRHVLRLTRKKAESEEQTTTKQELTEDEEEEEEEEEEEVDNPDN